MIFSPSPGSPQSLLSLGGCRNPTPGRGFSTERQRPLLPRPICCRSWLWLLWHKAPGLGMPPAPLRSPGRLVPTKAFGGSCKSRAPGTWANLSTCRLCAAAAVQGAVIWDSEPCLRCRMLFRCSLVFISPVQSSSQHCNFQLTLSKYHDPLCQGTTEASQPAAYSITPRHKHRSPSTPPHYLV